jgi:hypothetical protein
MSEKIIRSCCSTPIELIFSKLFPTSEIRLLLLIKLLGHNNPLEEIVLNVSTTVCFTDLGKLNLLKVIRF